MNLPEKLASTILDGYEAMFTEFMRVTLGAQQRFEQAEWHDVHAAMRLRLTVYKQKVGDVEDLCREAAGDLLSDRESWRQVQSSATLLLHSSCF